MLILKIAVKRNSGNAISSCSLCSILKYFTYHSYRPAAITLKMSPVYSYIVCRSVYLDLYIFEYQIERKGILHRMKASIS